GYGGHGRHGVVRDRLAPGLKRGFAGALRDFVQQAPVLFREGIVFRHGAAAAFGGCKLRPSVTYLALQEQDAPKPAPRDHELGVNAP
ncbi:MAG: hypothetical protein ABJI82_09535, partial [Alphaproteobacteria bacterium]